MYANCFSRSLTSFAVPIIFSRVFFGKLEKGSLSIFESKHVVKGLKLAFVEMLPALAGGVNLQGKTHDPGLKIRRHLWLLTLTKLFSSGKNEKEALAFLSTHNILPGASVKKQQWTPAWQVAELELDYEKLEKAVETNGSCSYILETLMKDEEDKMLEGDTSLYGEDNGNSFYEYSESDSYGDGGERQGSNSDSGEELTLRTTNMRMS
ncbi:hypothetical protein M413DRAFT_13917 [Hebeloma cylindrosporum]|uniref:Uncharacterized protein n=1 Tax=Hebeloma cylindrosporum TaxID=76867 RepID=A0A0C2XFA6_HEBCY|nr:hypothetical protein M413DRAFT_13917 [Hebeloma cylindrosporum h7]